MPSSKNNLVLSVNAGSSSLKISVFKPLESTDDISSEPIKLLVTSTITNLSSPPALFSFSSPSDATYASSTKDEQCSDIKDHNSAFQHFLKYLGDKTILNVDDIRHVCHRVVHGGDYPGPVKISRETYHHIESLSDLAPLHNAPALAVITTCLSLLPGADSIAFFDSMFHSTIPDYVSRYAIDPAVAEARGLKKYGFHGLSYSYILRHTALHLRKEPSETSLIVCHLGSGASMCAIKNGQSVDTTMGLTPLHGLPGATRSGSVDPSLIFHYSSKPGDMEDVGRPSRERTGDVHISLAEEILNKQAGWKALTGTTNFADITKKRDSDPKCALAFNMFVDRILHYLGAYFLKLGGATCVDALVFSGGIGEKSVELRRAVVEGAKCLGFIVDDEKNGSVDGTKGAVVDVSGREGRMRTLVCRTDEQLEMARQCVQVDNFIE